LKDLDVFSKSDPYLKFYMQTNFNGNIDYLGRTETINNNINPNWKNKICTQFYFEMSQPIKIEVYDEDN
jgi:Ca2+-dependent lipid-binding protein